MKDERFADSCDLLKWFQVRRPVPSGSFDRVELARFVDRHGLWFHLATQLDATALQELLPASWLDRLELRCRKQVAKQQRLVGLLMDVARLLQQERRPFVVLKGPYWAERYYGGLERRSFSDLDILVRPEDLAPVHALLTAAGFSRWSGVLLSQAATARFLHAFDFARDKLTLDLHWTLAVHPSFRLDDAAWWRQPQYFQLAGRSLPVLADEYDLVLCLLSMVRDIERGGVRLKAFVDLHAMLAAVEARIDWSSFFLNRRRERVARPCRAVLDAFFTLFGCQGRFPALAEALERDGGRRPTTGSDVARMLFRASPGALAQKCWTYRQYECPPVQSWAWWACSLPFRLMAFRRGLLLRRIRHWKERLLGTRPAGDRRMADAFHEPLKRN